MTRWARNERLYRHLLGMGLVVEPIFADEDKTQIDHLRVTTELPFVQDASQQTAEPGIGAPVQGAKVLKIVRSAESDGDDVVDLPPVL